MKSVQSTYISLFTLLLLGVSTVEAKRASSLRDGELPEGVVEYEWPKYPYLARLHQLDGYGLYRLVVERETGRVSSVEVVKTTTHKVLDDCAVEAFRKWRFRPHGVKTVVIPATFTIVGRPVSEARRLAVHAPSPERLRSSRRGSGTFRFIIDYETGAVKDVVVVRPSGREDFDRAVVKAYRQWRFVPRQARSIDTTVGFAPY